MIVREVREEVGCGISKIKELGETLEFRNQTKSIDNALSRVKAKGKHILALFDKKNKKLNL